ncbi:MAG: hypothetical protein EPO28_04930 [Saprospiraceae bacterium]|nr:MAG: hypothetical protein EPO28_04930 [Saprospiraceae bacterium]
MFDKNSLSLGLLIAIALPLLAFGIFYGIFEGLEALGWVSTEGFRPMFRERTLSILAIGMNALALQFYQKRKASETMRGIVIPTTVWVVVWLLVFGRYIL